MTTTTILEDILPFPRIPMEPVPLPVVQAEEPGETAVVIFDCSDHYEAYPKVFHCMDVENWSHQQVGKINAYAKRIGSIDWLVYCPPVGIEQRWNRLRMKCPDCRDIMTDLGPYLLPSDREFQHYGEANPPPGQPMPRSLFWPHVDGIAPEHFHVTA